jgi:hypothetical protein
VYDVRASSISFTDDVDFPGGCFRLNCERKTVVALLPPRVVLRRLILPGRCTVPKHDDRPTTYRPRDTSEWMAWNMWFKSGRHWQHAELNAAQLVAKHGRPNWWRCAPTSLPPVNAAAAPGGVHACMTSSLRALFWRLLYITQPPIGRRHCRRHFSRRSSKRRSCAASASSQRSVWWAIK